MPSTTEPPAAVDDGFARLREDPRFREALAGPPPTRPGASSTRTGRLGGALLTLIVGAPLTLVALTLMVCLGAASQVRPVPGWVLLGFGALTGVGVVACVLAWRSVFDTGLRSPGSVVFRAAARVERLDRRGAGSVELRFSDGVLRTAGAADSLLRGLVTGDLGVAALQHGRLVDFTVLTPRAPPPPRRAD